MPYLLDHTYWLSLSIGDEIEMLGEIQEYGRAFDHARYDHDRNSYCVSEFSHHKSAGDFSHLSELHTIRSRSHLILLAEPESTKAEMVEPPFGQTVARLWGPIQRYNGRGQK